MRKNWLDRFGGAPGNESFIAYIILTRSESATYGRIYRNFLDYVWRNSWANSLCQNHSIECNEIKIHIFPLIPSLPEGHSWLSIMWRGIVLLVGCNTLRETCRRWGIYAYGKEDSSPIDSYRLVPTRKRSITTIQTFKLQFKADHLQ